MDAGELAQRVETALDLAARQRFGAPAGRTPALLHELYVAAELEPAARVRVGAALARVWAYANDAPRGAPFAQEAVRVAGELGDPLLLAEALDARLTTCWGPDDIGDRLETSIRLLKVVAHVSDPDVRLTAYLWRLTTGMEHLDLTAARRQLAALDLLAEETGDDRIRFVACSRRAMFALTEADPVGAAALAKEAARAGAAAGVADAEVVVHTLQAELARQRGDRTALAQQAASFEEYGAGQGIPSVLAEAAVLRLESGDPDRAARLVDQLARGLDDLPRDVDWLLVVTKVCEAAAGSSRPEVAQRCAQLLAPYAGRGVLNSGAVAFAGVVDDYLALATGDPDHATRARTAYARLGADWWSQRGDIPRQRGPLRATVLHLHPTGDEAPPSLWCVGREGGVRMLPSTSGLEYLRLLLERPGIDVPALDLSAAAREPTAVASSDAASERAVPQAIAAALTRLEMYDPEVAHELRRTIRTGSTCCYKPDPFRPVVWRLGHARCGSGRARGS